MINALGDVLIEHASACQAEAVLISPFIKHDVLQNICSTLNERVRLTCITRWNYDEILCGVSDIEIWEIISSRPGASLRLLDRLHTKFYRFDETILIGSANLTGAALGWSKRPNHEILLQPCEADAAHRHAANLIFQSIEVTDAIYRAFRDALSLLPKPTFMPHDVSAVEVEDIAEDSRDINSERRWFPRTRHPSDLFLAYSGDMNRLTAAGRISADFDLRFLELQPGLNQKAFTTAVSLKLLAWPFLDKLDRFTSEPKRFGEMAEFIATTYSCESKNHANEMWQTLMRWLLLFFPDRFDLKVPSHSEIFYRKKPSLF